MANSGQKNWFGFPQQRIVGIHLAYEIAKVHADKMTPEEIADFVVKLNNAVYQKLVKGEWWLQHLVLALLALKNCKMY